MKNQQWARYGKVNGHYKHGLRKSRLFRIWSNMKSRCYNPNVSSYRNYGGKGITICDEWLDSFQAFYDWAMQNGYTDDLSIDRINFAGNYCPENCRWVTTRQQNVNRSNNHYVTFNGVTMTLMEWCEFYGINYKTVRDRLHRGWTYEKALTTEVNRRWSCSHGN